MKKLLPTSDSDSERLAVVLRHVLDEHPTPLRVGDLVRELSDEPGEFMADDLVRLAVRELEKGGLLQCPAGDLVLPTRQAVYYDDIASFMA